MPAYKNTSTQNLNTLAYNATGINNSQDKISDAMTALYFGINQWGLYEDTRDIVDAINNRNITLDTYIAFVSRNRIVDTAGNILEKYA